MKVVILGATGNIGTAVTERLLDDDRVTELVGVARREPTTPEAARPGGRPVRWVRADVRSDDLGPVLEGAAAVVHLAWMFQPARRPEVTWEANAEGTARVLDAATRAGVPRAVVASSIAAYSPGRDAGPVDESWPTHGASAAAYAREKAYVERLLDAHEARGDSPEVVRLRPAFVFQRRASSEQRRIFGGPLVPQQLVRPGLVPVLPLPRGLRLQVIHASDVADAAARAVFAGSPGAYNLCADEVLDPDDLAAVFEAHKVELPVSLVRSTMSLGWLAHALPADPRLLDALMRLPVMSNERARRELSWSPSRSAASVVAELLAGLRAKDGHGTEPLQPA